MALIPFVGMLWLSESRFKILSGRNVIQPEQTPRSFAKLVVQTQVVYINERLELYRRRSKLSYMFRSHTYSLFGLGSQSPMETETAGRRREDLLANEVPPGRRITACCRDAFTPMSLISSPRRLWDLLPLLLQRSPWLEPSRELPPQRQSLNSQILDSFLCSLWKLCRPGYL